MNHILMMKLIISWWFGRSIIHILFPHVSESENVFLGPDGQGNCNTIILPLCQFCYNAWHTFFSTKTEPTSGTQQRILYGLRWPSSLDVIKYVVDKHLLQNRASHNSQHKHQLWRQLVVNFSPLGHSLIFLDLVCCVLLLLDSIFFSQNISEQLKNMKHNTMANLHRARCAQLSCRKCACKLSILAHHMLHCTGVKQLLRSVIQCSFSC